MHHQSKSAQTVRTSLFAQRSKRRLQVAVLAVAESLETRRLFSVVTVTTTSDTNAFDSDITLREALDFVNGTYGLGAFSAAEQTHIDLTQPLGTNDTIKFAIPGGGQQKIDLAAKLPTIINPVFINGYTQPGSAAATDNAKATINVELYGFDIDDGQGNSAGLTIAAENVTVRGLDIVNFSGAGIDLVSGSGNDVIAGNYIGLTTGADPKNAGNSNGLAVEISSNNSIGGTTAADRNVISGNNQSGIDLGTRSSNNKIEGNYIGTLSDGSAALSNFGAGISVSQSKFNTIGGTTAGARNIISGNNLYGIKFDSVGAGVAGNVVEGNYIGTDVTGNIAVKNGQGGVDIDGSGSSQPLISNVTIGGTAAGVGNVISGNDGDGIFIYTEGAQYNTIQGNRIGTNAAGTAALGNALYGIQIFRSDGNLIGGADAGAGNVISANGSDGVHVYGSTLEVVQGNLIGVFADGTTAAGNDGIGVNFQGETTDSLVGAGVASTANIIAYNSIGVGIEALDGNIPNTNTVRLNSIFSNVGLGIDLFSVAQGTSDAGVTQNDNGDGDGGPNDLQNFPLIDTAVATDTTITISGSFNSAPSLNYLLDFYASPTADASGYGEGKQYLGSLQISTDINGDATYTANFNMTVGANLYVTATATELNGSGAGDTSEFSQAVKATDNQTPPPPPPVLPTISINDVSQNEGTGVTTSFTFTITRSGDLTGTSTVNYATADGAAPSAAVAPVDYTATSGTATFIANQATATVTVLVNGDTTVEGNETFVVNLSAPTNATISDAQGVGTIANDDVATPPTIPSVAINDIAASEGNGGTTAFTFTLTRSGDLSAASTVSVSTANNTASSSSDYTAASGTPVTFAINQATATVTVFVNGDTTAENDETFFVNVAAVSNATISDGQGVGTILNDDVAPIVIKAPTKLTGSATSSSAVSLKWKDNASNETGFEIQYSTSSDFSSPATVPLPGANITASTVGSLNANTTYYFRVRATGPGGTVSGYSNTLKLTTKKAPVPAPAITGFNLIDSDTKQVVLVITDGMVIHRSSFPSLKNYTVQAVVGGTVESVKFSYKGKTSTQNIPPYSLFGDHGVGNYDGQPFANGSYTITATPYTLDNAKGTAGSAKTIRFTVVA